MVRKNNMNYFHPPIIKKISFIVNLRKERMKRNYEKYRINKKR